MSDIQLHITGMTCTACSARIEKALTRMDGVRGASVSLALSSATVSLADGGDGADVGAVLHRIRQLGYGAEAKEPGGGVNPFRNEARAWRDRFLLALLGSLPLLAAMLAHVYEPLGRAVPPFALNPAYQFGIGSILFFYCGHPYFVGAYRAMRPFKPNMDVLIAVSLAAAYVYSVCLLPAMPGGLRTAGGHGGHGGTSHLYFDSIAMIVTAVTLGKWAEAIAKGQAFRSLSALYEQRPSAVRIVLSGREEAYVPPERVQAGYRVKVLAGERISADGVIEDGRAEVDESLLTGESDAVARRPGDRLFAGTRLVGGAVVLRATAPGAQTRLSQLIAMVEQAQAMKPRIQRQADRIAGWFVPAILALAAATFAAWSAVGPSADAFRCAMAVVLVACPCALGLATPLSVLIGSSLAARAGILFKEGSMLETLSRADLFLFDKTGTLTHGKPHLADIRAPGMPPATLLKWTASVERGSDHPLARAIVQAAHAKQLLLETARDVVEEPGGGISGAVDGRRLDIGRPLWLRERGVDVPEAEPSAIEREAATVLHVAVGGRWCGAMTFRDQVRDDARETVRALAAHAGVAMATGDGEPAARRIARETGIDAVHARLLPEHKLALIVRHQRQGKTVAMVGDGVNDAAALAAADVGIVMAGGNDAAMQAGDVVVIGGRLAKIGEARAIASRTMRNIRQNFAIAFVYNAAMIPLAMAGLLDPRLACVGMACSSLGVVGNALRLMRTSAPAARGDGKGGRR